MKRFPRAIAGLALLASVLAFANACGTKLPPATIGAPRFPEFILPTLSPPDPRQAELVTAHQAGWQLLQAGDLNRATGAFQAVLKRSPAFYPSETALGYVELARRDYARALNYFDRVIVARETYVPALVGRGTSLLALARESDALAAFEEALRQDPTLTEVGQRIVVLRARAQQENVAAAGRAAQAGRLDEAVRAYEQAIAASPESAFLFRDLADVELRQGKSDRSLEHYRRAIQLDPADVVSRVLVGEILDAGGDVEGAMAIYTEAYALEPNADIRRRMSVLEARAAYLRLPAEYRGISERPAVSRADLAALVGIRLEAFLAAAPAQSVVVTDTRNHWAARWINATLRAGVMDAYDNHTFQPGASLRRSDLARAVSRALKIIAARDPGLLKEWQGRQARMTDVGVSNLNYADASLAVSAGVLSLTDEGLFQLSRLVSGEEAIDAVARLERLYNTSK